MATMNRRHSRRTFIKDAGLAVGLLSSAVPESRADLSPQSQPATKAPGRPKVGCVSWCFHGFEGGSSPEAALDILGEIGFEGTDLILLAREDIQGYWSDVRIDRIKQQLERNRLEVAQFVIFQPVIEGLTSLDPDERNRNLDYFEAGCHIGKKLGAPIINMVAPWPRELKGPTNYLPRYFELSEPKPQEKFHIEVAQGFDWQRVWQTYIETTRACLQRIKALGLKLSIEHHTHCMVHDATSFLRLWDAVRDPNLGYNLDTGWTLSQREYPPVAIHKVKDHLMNLHVRDIDGRMRRFVHVGQGVMDFKAIASALKTIGYRGFLSIEQDKHPGDMKETCRRYLQMMKEYLTS
ncbi:MAG: sugar phosphate isomerase/epimerase [Acidobacteriota bacterium]